MGPGVSSALLSSHSTHVPPLPSHNDGPFRLPRIQHQRAQIDPSDSELQVAHGGGQRACLEGAGGAYVC